MTLDRTNRLLLGTAAVLILLTAARIWQQTRPIPSLFIVPAVVEDDATSLWFKTPDGELQIDRADSGWKIVKPAEMTADSKKVEMLLRDWGEAFSPDLRLLDSASDAELEQFGLDEKGRTELRVSGKAGTLVDLRVGKAIAGGSNWLQRADDPAVYRGRVPGGYRLKPLTDEWRDKRLFPFEKDDLAALSLQSKVRDYRFIRTEADTKASWSAEKPEKFVVSSRSLDTLGRSLANLKAQKILEGAEADEARPKAGFDTPRLTVVAETESGASYTLKFAAEQDPNRTVYAQLGDDNRVFVLPIANLRQFDKDAQEWRDKTVVQFTRDDQTSVTYSEGERRIVAVPEAERDWKIEEPEGFRPSPKELNLAVNSLLNLQATEVAEGVDAGIEGGGPAVTIRTKEGEQILRIGRSPEKGKYYATVDGKKDVYVLRDAVVTRILETFRGPKGS
jgi:hypothetical protein